MKLSKKVMLITTLLNSVLFIACKKNDIGTSEKLPAIENPLIRKDSNFPTGVLQFNSTASIKSFYENAEKDPEYASKITGGFKTFKVYIDEYNLATEALFNSTISNATKNMSIEADSTEFINDMKSLMLPLSDIGNLLNPDMEVIVADTLYQFTHIGIFKVNLSTILSYKTFYNTNKDKIFFDSNYINTSNETLIKSKEYLLQPNIKKSADVTIGNANYKELEYISDGGGCTNGCAGSTAYYVNSTVGDNFKKEVSILFNDWAKRRLVFNTQKINLELFGFGFHKIDISAKIQREKKFWGFSYWGPSYADELIVGCDNMALETDYIFPHPQNFSTITRPTFEGLADFKIGNWVVRTLNLKVNYTALGYTLNSAEIASMINSNFNSVVGKQYNNTFKEIERKFINSIDPSYLSTYANYTIKVNQLKADNVLKWVIGKAEKPQGYSDDNTWTFDWNIGGSWSTGSGPSAPGGYPAQYQYKYDMKSGSFFCRARVGNIWHGIRIVKI